MGKIDFNDESQIKKLTKKKKKADKEVNVNVDGNFVQSIIKRKGMKVGIFLLSFFLFQGFVSTFYFLFTHPANYIGVVSISGVVAYIIYLIIKTKKTWLQRKKLY